MLTNYNNIHASNNEHTTQAHELSALFRIRDTTPRDMGKLLIRIKNETRSLNAIISPGHPQAVFISYRPTVVDLQDIRRDLKRCGIHATLVTC